MLNTQVGEVAAQSRRPTKHGLLFPAPMSPVTSRAQTNGAIHGAVAGKDTACSLVQLFFKSRFMGLFQHCGRSAYCILTPDKFPHSSPEAPRIIQMRDTSTSEGGNYYQ